VLKGTDTTTVDYIYDIYGEQVYKMYRGGELTDALIYE